MERAFFGQVVYKIDLPSVFVSDCQGWSAESSLPASTEMAANPIVERHVRERRLYIGIALFLPLIVLLGFSRTYYLKGLFHTPVLPSLLVHVHGLVMTSWVILFGVQVGLISARRTKVHQRLGVWVAILAGLVVVVGFATALTAAAREAANPEALRFLIVPIGDVLVFSVLVGMALYYRRRVQVHKRLMVVAALSLLTPAFSRIPLEFIVKGGPLASFALTDLSILACVIYDTAKHRRLHSAFLWGTLLVVASQALRLMLAGTNIWLKFAGLLVRLVS